MICAISGIYPSKGGWVVCPSISFPFLLSKIWSSSRYLTPWGNLKDEKLWKWSNRIEETWVPENHGSPILIISRLHKGERNTVFVLRHYHSAFYCYVHPNLTLTGYKLQANHWISFIYHNIYWYLHKIYMVMDKLYNFSTAQFPHL